MAPQKIKITKNEIPNAILSDDVYDICCQYFTNGRLTSIYDPHKYFCNQSNKFQTTLRNINEELKKIMIMSTVIFFQQLINMLKTSNNTIEHSSSNQPTLVNSCEKGSSKDSTATNEEISNSTIEHSSNPVVDNSSSQSQHQAWNAETTDLKIKIVKYETENTNIRTRITTLEKDKTDLKFKIEGLEKDNTELKSKNAGLEKNNEKLRSANTNLEVQIAESKLKIKELSEKEIDLQIQLTSLEAHLKTLNDQYTTLLAKIEKDEEVIKYLEKEITETNEEKVKVEKNLLAIIDDRNEEIKSKNEKIDKLKAENLKLIMEQKKGKKCNKY
ncbi:hypothetical protein C2G38_2256387 [Gigaspora rosea]|uniref:Uncharacterized protein n=1 Tax=Gigaspora rosea TaxID=44941 RepID=A0A397U1S5_9GLOM|nr:hypothetical protein C2G38_2256387 [Gigaspora rosea]